MSDYTYTSPDPELGKLFAAAEAQLQAVATSHGFSLRLVDDGKGTWFFYPEVEEPDPEPGPTYDVWIAEPGAHTLARALGGLTEHHKPWAWQSCGTTFTCDDDPDGKGARHFAHDYARHLRATYPCAFVAVRRADKGLPPPVHNPDAPALAGEGEMDDFSSSWLGQ